jgi:integrase
MALTIADMQLTADGHPSAQTAAFAVRCIRPALKWAARPGRAYVQPDLANIHPPATVQRRDRVLSRDELARIIPALCQSTAPYAMALRFLLLTLTRRSEVASAVWGDIDLVAHTWTIPRTKNGMPHIVPLSGQAVALLRQMGPGKPGQPVFAARNGSALAGGAWEQVTKDVQKVSGTAGWHRHDLRRTGATMLGEMGELPDIIEAALNHVSIRSPLAATYNRSRYRPQVATALQRLADALDGIEAGAAKVVPLRAGA